MLLGSLEGKIKGYKVDFELSLWWRGFRLCNDMEVGLNL